MSSTLHPDNDRQLNPSSNPSIQEVISEFEGRRHFLRAAVSSAAALALTGLGRGTHAAKTAQPPVKASAHTSPAITFKGIAANLANGFKDQVTVPAGYTARVLIAWGDAIGLPGSAARTHWDASKPMTEALQLSTWGMHNDGMHFFARGKASSSKANKAPKSKQHEPWRGLLVANHEYIDPGLLMGTSSYKTDPLTPSKVDLQLAAHGVSVIELRQVRGHMQVLRPSAYARRITGQTPCKISGPASAHPLMKTAADPSGTRVLGTLNNCANGFTPWGTYLTCEENFNSYFGTAPDKIAAQPLTALEARYGLSATGAGVRWHEADKRFDLRDNPNEPNRFGWVVEIDPWSPRSMPVKRTALGRFKHESATLVVGQDNTVAVYMGDDERNDYIYKFVCAQKFNAAKPKANRDLLDNGTLYVAKFNADGTGQWLPLVWGQQGLTADNGFADQGEVLIKARQAADRLGATMMDRPEWVAVHPHTREVYVTLTNNTRRGSTPASSNAASGRSVASSSRPAVDAANPRADNRYGHILRWTEKASFVGATQFEWDIFVQCGDRLDPDPQHQGNIIGDDLGAPDGLRFDQDGRLWIQTDQQGDATGDWANIGGNLMACADPISRRITRFLTGPRNCEVTGITSTPDGKTMFVGIQHPGEDWSGSFTQQSTWPDSGANGTTTQKQVLVPRSAVVAITKNDGGVIGT